MTAVLGPPLGMLVLFVYTRSIKKHGSRYTLRLSNFICTMFFGLMTHFTTFQTSSAKSTLAQFTIISFYSIREIYVSLLSTQQWAFIATHLDRNTSSYLVTFTGMVSIASAVGGVAIEYIVFLGGVKLLMAVSLLSILLTFICSEISYYLVNKSAADAESYSLHPSKSMQSLVNFIGSKLPPMKIIMNSSNNLRDYRQWTKQDAIRGMSSLASRAFDMGKSAFSPIRRSHDRKDHKDTDGTKPCHSGIYAFCVDSWNLMCKHHILQLLFVEAITHQMCTNMLNLMFHNGLGLEVSENSVRATLVGRFFATVNITACSLQFFILPGILQNSLPNVLSKIPIIVLFAVTLGVVRPGLISVMLGFGTIKVLEYSIMTAASEMIYMPMGHEVRYLGKELIKFFGHKVGKSASSLILSGLIAQVKPSLATQSMWGALFAMCWGVTMYQLSQFLIRREHRESAEKAAAAYASLQSSSEGTTGDTDKLLGVSLEEESPTKGDFKPISEGTTTSEESSSNRTSSSNSSFSQNNEIEEGNSSKYSSFASFESTNNFDFDDNNSERVKDFVPYSPSQDAGFADGIYLDEEEEQESEGPAGKITPLVVGCEFLPANNNHSSSLIVGENDAVDRGDGPNVNSNNQDKQRSGRLKGSRRSPKGAKKSAKCSTKPVLFRIGSNSISLNTLRYKS